MYAGTVCRNELEMSLRCFTGNTALSPPLSIPSNGEVIQKEETLLGFFRGLQLLNPSEECERGIRSFLCLQMLGLCDDDNVFHTIDTETCVHLRDSICPNEWMIGLQFLGPDGLPVCEELQMSTQYCAGKNWWVTFFYESYMPR